MLDPEAFIIEMKTKGFTFFSGVPCSFLSGFINAAESHCDYVSAVNEGDAVAICAGAHLGGKKAVVLMQNSGLTNAISPLSSLTYTYQIPLLGFVSLRGEPGLHDEPQHELMGEITTSILDLLKIDWDYLSPDPTTADKQLERANRIIEGGKIFFLVVRKNTFHKLDPQIENPENPKVRNQVKKTKDDALPTRIKVLTAVNSLRDDNTYLLSTTGYTSRELFEIEDGDHNFYMFGSMGCASSIGLGLSLANPDKKIIILDGDGALLMRLGCLSTIGCYGGENILHILIDNNSYESTGGQRTTSDTVNFVDVAAACGYAHSIYIHDLEELQSFLKDWKRRPSLSFLYIKIREGNVDNLGRPTISPIMIKERFMEALHD